MDIKIIPKEAHTKCYYLDKDLILMIRAKKETVDKAESVIPFPSVDYYLYHVDTNTRENILPNVNKYMVCDLHFCEKTVTEIYFFYLEYTKYPVVTFSLFSYNISTRVCREVYRFEDNIKRYETERRMDLFALNSNYFLLQTKILTSNIRCDYRGYTAFEIFLYDNNNRMKFEIADKRLLKGGIMQMFPLAKNICAIRMGYNLVDENRIDHLMKKEAAEEYIGIISVSQFISDMILKLPVFTMEYIDEVYYDMTLSDISKQGKYLIYSRINTDDYSQEIIFYEYVKKDTLMVVNKNPYNRDLIMPCVLNKRPYLIRKKKNHREFYYIKKNNVMLKLPSENEIVDLLNDFIVIKSHKRPLFKKPESYLDVYRYDDMTRVYREKTDCTPQCLINGGDDLLIFVEGK